MNTCAKTASSSSDRFGYMLLAYRPAMRAPNRVRQYYVVSPTSFEEIPPAGGTWKRNISTTYICPTRSISEFRETAESGSDPADLRYEYNPYVTLIPLTPGDDLADLRYGYNVILEKEGAIRRYLNKFPDLYSPLKTLVRLSREEFGRNAELALQCYKDPELTDYKYLCLIVRLDDYPADLMDRFARISAEIRSDLARSSGWLILDTDYRSPSR
jgi:hypothetical protein